MVIALMINDGINPPYPNPNITEEQRTQRLAEMVIENRQSLRVCAREYIDAAVDIDDKLTISEGCKLKGIKALACRVWMRSVRTLMRTRLATVTSTHDPLLCDFTSCGPLPYTMAEVEAEIAAWVPPTLTDLAASPTTAQMRTAINAINAAMRMQGFAQ